MKFVKTDGVSLIEVLVTTLILGIGLLGVAAMQVTSVNSSQEGYYRSQATEIAESVASRMRTTRMSIYDGITTFADVIEDYAGEPYDCSAVKSCIGSDCNDEELVNFDKWQLCQVASRDLPGGEIYVRNVSGLRSRVAVSWDVAQARQDTGQRTILNNQCSSVGVPDNQGKDCVVLEIIP
ncbi:type IV pilus modification protein PilV [Pleionea mediterranea]|uniref:Type IV pilus modification protein PilV n=1 Tax=Pleionea mediterranea TaxID=523701 RepID=A0A316FS15_9GAMM|nr:type IV pilus modification protein PilV [Pleionea mediterranea]PWK50915.1 type IV pilus modification protein PilV [Pleionea mediterranea]